MFHNQHTYGHTLHVLCSRKSLCSYQTLKIKKKLLKINKCVIKSDTAKSELIKTPYKTASLLSEHNFHTLRNLLDKQAPVHKYKTIAFYSVLFKYVMHLLLENIVM